MHFYFVVISIGIYFPTHIELWLLVLEIIIFITKLKGFKSFIYLFGQLIHSSIVHGGKKEPKMNN